MAKGKGKPAKGKKEAAPDEGAAEKGKKGAKGKDKKDKKDKSGKHGKGSEGSSRSDSRSSHKSASLPKTPPKTPPPEPVAAAAAAGPPCQYEDEACEKGAILCQPNRYPGLLADPQPMAIVGSENGTYESLCKLLRVGFRCADRVFAMTPWGNYVVFRGHSSMNKIFFIFDGCTCNVNRFRYLDLTCGTAGLLYFEFLHNVITYIIDSRKTREILQNIRKSVIDDICHEFCDYGRN